MGYGIPAILSATTEASKMIYSQINVHCYEMSPNRKLVFYLAYHMCHILYILGKSSGFLSGLSRLDLHTGLISLDLSTQILKGVHKLI